MGKNKSSDQTNIFDMNVDDDEESLDFDLEQLQFERELAGHRPGAKPPGPPIPEKLENTFRLVDQPPAGGSPPPFTDVKTQTKVSYGVAAAPRPTTDFPERVMSSVEATLKQSEHLRIAQNRINALEEEIENLRRENEQMGSAGETFKRINEEYFATIDQLKHKLSETRLTYNNEVELLKKINRGKDKQILELKQQIDELKSRLDNNFKGVRKREKDLEHRLEIAKVEEQAVVRSKDQLILDLKRKIDRINLESENFRQKSQENYRELQKKNQVIRGVVRALRIALTKLEGDDDSEDDLEFKNSQEDGDDQAS